MLAQLSTSNDCWPPQKGADFLMTLDLPVRAKGSIFSFPKRSTRQLKLVKNIKSLEEFDMGIDYQLHRVSVDIAKGYRQIQRAENDLGKGKTDAAVNRYSDALNDFGAAIDHAAKAEDDAATKAGKELDKGNTDLQKCIDAYGDGNADAAVGYYDSAVENYDKALDLIG
jgi:tetratricopeptide (TPR) repeat protein